MMVWYLVVMSNDGAERFTKDFILSPHEKCNSCTMTMCDTGIYNLHCCKFSVFMVING